MDITLRDIDKTNWLTCIKLRPGEEQRYFIASNLFSLAEAKVYPECVPMGIYYGETMVGFLMYAPDQEAQGSYWIVRFMVDRDYQGKGYGTAAMREVIRLLENQAGVDQLLLSVVPENTAAEEFYTRLEFEKTDRKVEDEQVMRLILNPARASPPGPDPAEAGPTTAGPATAGQA
jgi:diamine N-acetyltransferase